MAERIAVDFVPVFAYECRYKQKQSAFWHVKIGDDSAYNVVGIARCNDDLRTCMERVKMVLCQVSGYGLKSFAGGNVFVFVGQLVRHPLIDVQIVQK